MNALKGEKKNDKVFYSSDTGQIISETCGLSERQIFNTKKSKGRKIEEENLPNLKILNKDPCLV